MNLTLEQKSLRVAKMREALATGDHAEAYRLFNPIWSDKLDRLPPNLRPDLVRYILTGSPVGHFLTALIANDLMEATARADDTTMKNLRTLCQFLYNFAPGSCHGSEDKMKAWMAQGGALAIYYDEERGR